MARVVKSATSHLDIADSKKVGLMRFATAAEAAEQTADNVAVPASLVASAIPSASTTVAGKVELSTDAEAQAKSGSTVVTAGNLAAEGFLQWADVTITSAQVKALETTQIELVAAQGAGAAILFMGAHLKLNYGSNVFTEAGDNLSIKYTDDSGVAVSETIETTGFINQSADTMTNAVPVKDAIVAAASAENQALVLDNLGSAIAGNAAGDNTVTVRTYYVVHSI